MIFSIIFFPNGAFACFDENGKQVPEHSRNLLCEHLIKLYNQGLITKETRLETASQRGDGCTVEPYLGGR